VIAASALAVTPCGGQAAEVFGGLYAHDIDDGISIGHSPEEGMQVVAGVRTSRLEGLRPLGAPQAHLLAGVNTTGGLHYAAVGLSWRAGLAAGGRLYLRPGIGVAAHTGKAGLPSPFAPGLTPAERQRRRQAFDTRLDLGSRILFEPELALGWQAGERWAVELSWIHLSHAQLAGEQNPGLGDLGIRAVYRAR